jgi:hypothetical protein
VRATSSLIATALLLADCSEAPYGPDRQMSDQDLVAFAQSPFGDEEKQATDGDDPPPTIPGIHQGARVVVDYPCGDLCPDYTVRVIHYNAEPGAECDRVGGTVRTEWIADGPAKFATDFCIPAAIVAIPSKGG